ncbi:MAG: type II secretion system protein [Synergistaceae bacterium]|nr:type II secretion system protein [Synergistaceae bacterium]
MKSSKRRGFTLVELLIVIVVIGVLSAMMMLSSTEAVSSAKASNIISNLRNLKTATLAWYADNLDKIQTDGRVKIDDTTKPIQEWDDSYIHLLKYLNGESIPYKKGATSDSGFYCVFDAGGSDRTTWYVGYRFNDGEDTVREKIRNRASSLGLHFTDTTPNSGAKTKVGEGKIVWMKVMGDCDASKKSSS